ncbi:hypothetical protein [Actinacidiphila guanduensis]|jgi:hypothetical protein|uniref:Uncharacterized protein n=1 Tax=Actinacidiphila guanduensis TaxID=310781 RepID=A0A1H0MMH3_9ACTN|nr:hypothetical protein [Actinacidiphila guanduensis]SDO81486.1 hypothetical protein SAMN05216259_11316 [Actinacidiphila guanduensis]
MPLLVPPAPAPALLSVLAALSSPTAVREARTPALRSAEGPLDAEHPLPVHVFEPATVPGGLPQARLAGWRFHIRAGAQVAAAGETVATPDGWVFSRFSEGPYIASTERALRQADALPETYQPHLLSLPARYMMALWLHSVPRADAATAQPDPADLLIPLAPAPPGIASHRVYRMLELAPVLSVWLAPPPLAGSPA